MTEESILTPLPATQVRYRYASVHRIVGFSELRTAPDLATMRELALNLGIPGVSAVLSGDPNTALAAIDRDTAFGHLMLRGLVGQSPTGHVLESVEATAVQFSQERLKRLGNSGVYLVLDAQGELVSTPAPVARDFGSALLAFDAVDKQALRAQYAPLVSTASAAVSLAVDTTSDVTPVADGVSLTLPDGRPLYSVTFTGNAATLITSRPATDSDTRAIEKHMKALLSDERLATPSRLLVDALRSTQDRLKAFIFGWAALEMVIRKFTGRCESGEWVKSLSDEDRQTGAAIHQDYADGGHQFYSLAARALAFALIFKMGAGDKLAAEVTRIRKAYREPLYHEGEIVDHLPVETVVALVRRVIDAVVRCR